MNFVENNLALVLVSLTIIIVERVVKFYVTDGLRIGESIPVLGNFLMITRTENMGAGFGIFQGYNFMFIIAACIVLFLIVYFYNMIIYNRLLVFAFAFLLAGTVGNMMDRLFFGHVIDYINLIFWPTFNLSDVSLTVGAALLIFYMYTWQTKPEEEIKFSRY